MGFETHQNLLYLISVPNEIFEANGGKNKCQIQRTFFLRMFTVFCAGQKRFNGGRTPRVPRRGMSGRPQQPLQRRDPVA